MTIASGAHVTIDGTDYLIAEDVDNHYVFVPQLVPIPTVDHGPGTVNPNNPYVDWQITDWAGGEGNRWFDPSEAGRDVYDYSTGLNGRIKGQLTGRPARVSTTITGVSDARQRLYFEHALGCVWACGSTTIAFSTDYGASFTKKNSSGLTLKVTATAGATDAVYVAYGNGTNRGVLKHTAATAGGANTSVIDSHASTAPWIGACTFMGRLYLWTGRKLFECDVDQSLPLTLNSTYRKVGDTGADLDYSNFGGATPGSWWGDAIAGDDRMFTFVGMEGQTIVYQYYRGGFTDLWRIPQGFTGKSMTYENGKLYVGGHWSGESSPANGYGALYILDVNRMQPMFARFFRKQDGTNLQMQEMANSYGNQILTAGAKSGKVFVHDAEFNAASLLDDLALGADDKIADILTIGSKRLVGTYPAAAAGLSQTYTIYAYSDDEIANRESVGSVSGLLEEPQWNYWQPHVTKGLVGFYVVWTVEDTGTASGLLAHQRITISYAADGGSYTDLPAITSATTTSSGVRGRHFLTVPTGSGGTNVRFYNLKVKVTLDNDATSGVQPPILESIVATAVPVDFQNMWELVVDLRDEDSEQAEYNDIRGRQDKASVLRDKLRLIASNRKSITFVDGYRYADEWGTQSSSHTCFVEVLEDNVARHAEGIMRLRLLELPS